MKVFLPYKWSNQRVIPAPRADAPQSPPVAARMAVPLRHFNRFCGRGGLSFAMSLG
jgi:hypothetical protein